MWNLWALGVNLRVNLRDKFKHFEREFRRKFKRFECKILREFKSEFVR